jgi:hypothetical protein
VKRSATINGNAVLSNPRGPPVRGLMRSSSIKITKPPMPEISRVLERRVTREEKVKRRE